MPMLLSTWLCCRFVSSEVQTFFFLRGSKTFDIMKDAATPFITVSGLLDRRHGTWGGGGGVSGAVASQPTSQ